MTHHRTEALLKKINYIEADVEIQKQILFSIPSVQKPDIEKTISLIAAKKQEIEILRQELKELDPIEYDRILKFEDAVAKFKNIAVSTPFQSIVNRNVFEECSLALQDGKEVECLIKACDDNGNWTIITMNGEVNQFPAADVAEKPPKKSEL